MSDFNTSEKVCPNCGTSVPEGIARCTACDMPMTAYAGQVVGETYQGKLASQVATVNTRPPAVYAMAALCIFYALFWPLATVLGAFQSKPVINEEGTNYFAASFGSLGPIFTAILMVPAAIAFLVIAGLVWSQNTVAWTAALVVLILFVISIAVKFSAVSLLWLALAGGIGYLWFRPETKGWFGLD